MTTAKNLAATPEDDDYAEKVRIDKHVKSLPKPGFERFVADKRGELALTHDWVATYNKLNAGDYDHMK